MDVVRLLTEAGAQLNIQTKVNVHIMDVLSTTIGYKISHSRCYYNYIIIICGRKLKCYFLTHIS